MMETRKCAMCGAEFQGSTKRKFCDSCVAERNRAASAASYRRKLDGALRRIGNSDTCAMCGAPYTITGRAQRVCPDCRRFRECDATYAALKQKRAQARTLAPPRPCIICGKPIPPGANYQVVCCSPECNRERERRYNTQYVAARRQKEKQPPR